MVLAIYLFKYLYGVMNLTEDRICVCGGRKSDLSC